MHCLSAQAAGVYLCNGKKAVHLSLISTDRLSYNNQRQSSQVKLDVSLLEDIKDDMDFCLKLAKEESVVILPVIVLAKLCLLPKFIMRIPALTVNALYAYCCAYLC